jgi:hypothetical protein
MIQTVSGTQIKSLASIARIKFNSGISYVIKKLYSLISYGCLFEESYGAEDVRRNHEQPLQRARNPVLANEIKKIQIGDAPQTLDQRAVGYGIPKSVENCRPGV